MEKYSRTTIGPSPFSKLNSSQQSNLFRYDMPTYINYRYEWTNCMHETYKMYTINVQSSIGASFFFKKELVPVSFKCIFTI